MNKAETTYRIVKKLEKAEKKALSLEISKFKSSASYILIYNYFNKQEEFDQNHFTAFCKKNKLKYAGTLVNHLLNKILKILRKYRVTIHTDKIEIEIKKL